jgi:hypothetical protein
LKLPPCDRTPLIIKTLIVYATHDISDNLLFFLRHGYIDDEKYDYYFIFNHPTLKVDILPKKKNIFVVNRENINIDFGGWSHVLFMQNNNKYLYENYDYFIFINSTVRGPFVPIYCDNEWPQLFISKLNDSIKLVGPSINTAGISQGPNKYPHVQSMLMATDKIGLSIGLNNNIFKQHEPIMDKYTIIITKEIDFSTHIINAGYNIACMLHVYKNIDFRDKTKYKVDGDLLYNQAYFDMSVHPLEMIFFKTNRQIAELTLQRYTSWYNINKNIDISHITKILYGVSLINSLDITGCIKTYILGNHYINSTTNINKLVGQDPYVNIKKYLYIFSNDELIVVSEHNNELDRHILFV